MTEKEKIRHIQTIIVSACVVLALLLLIGLVSNIVSLASKNSRIEKIEAQIEALDREIRENDEEIEYRNTEKYREKYVRELLEMQKSNEIALIGK